MGLLGDLEGPTTVTLSNFGVYIYLCTSNSFESAHIHTDKTNILIVWFLATGTAMKRNSWATIYEKWSKFYRENFREFLFTPTNQTFGDFFLQTPSGATSHHPKPLCTEKYSPTKSYQICYLKAITVELGVVHNLFGCHGNHLSHMRWSAGDYS